MMNTETIDRCIDLQLQQLSETFDEIKEDVAEATEGFDLDAAYLYAADKIAMIELLREEKRKITAAKKGRM